MSSPKLQVNYLSWETLGREYKDQMVRQGLFLRTTEIELAQHAAVILLLLTPDGDFYELSGHVLHVFPGQGLAVQFSAASAKVIASLADVCAQRASLQPSAPADSASVQDPVISLADQARDAGILPNAQPQEDACGVADEEWANENSSDAEPEERANIESERVAADGTADPRLEDQTERTRTPRISSTDTLAAVYEVDRMTHAEKRQAALMGNRAMRAVLVRELNKELHVMVVKNPNIMLEEVEQIANMATVNPEALHIIATNRDWIRSLAVCRNLVRNPKTPTRDALELLPRLPMADIRALAKSDNVRFPIQQAARRRVNR